MTQWTRPLLGRANREVRLGTDGLGNEVLLQPVNQGRKEDHDSDTNSDTECNE